MARLRTLILAFGQRFTAARYVSSAIRQVADGGNLLDHNLAGRIIPAVNGVRMVGPWGQSCPIRGWAGLYSGPLCLFCFSSSLACRHLPIARRPAPAGCTKSSTTAAGRWPRRGPVGIRLITRRGNDWSDRFPLVVEALNHLKVRSRLIDGEVVCCDERGLAWFDVLRVRRNEIDAFLYAFDLLELDGADLRREPLEVRTATLASILRRSRQGGPERAPGARLRTDLLPTPLPLGCEGIVSKRLTSRYRSGRSPDWLKFKNLAAPAVQREGEEDGGSGSSR